MEKAILEDGILIKKARRAVQSDLKEKHRKNMPISRFDFKEGIVYLEHSDGTKEIVRTCINKGRYSERIKAQA